MAVLKKKTQAVQKVVKKVSTAKPAATTARAKVSANAGAYTFAVGRRKTSIARVRLFLGKGDTLVNEKSVAQYFGDISLHPILFSSLDAVEKREGVHCTIKVVGGGAHSQAQAIAHGIARALVKVDENYRSILRKAGLLTRDDRMRETRKIGTGGKARRAKQSPKR